MTTISISLPAALQDWVEDQARSGTFADAGDYVRDLIRRDRERAAAVAEIQTQLDEGFASGISDRSMAEVLEMPGRRPTRRRRIDLPHGATKTSSVGRRPSTITQGWPPPSFSPQIRSSRD